MQRTSASISLGWLPPWLVRTLGVLCALGALLAVCPSVRAGDATPFAPPRPRWLKRWKPAAISRCRTPPWKKRYSPLAPAGK